ncbi:MAG TPA: hypothetical protein VGV38_06780 [Pyrinomonadaceae bacterium]|nr:hypothetical protein [Pyrinomonadaceae bacterium]
MKEKLIYTRREFVAAGLLVVPLLKASACAAESNSGGCPPTARGAGGPFYRAGAPWTSRLCSPEEPGEPLLVAGRVTAADTCRPVAGALLDVFQADAEGRYDSQRPGFTPETFHLRGRMKADAEGRYRIETVLPGLYPGRARHIHFVVSAPGYAPLVTECYFEGDPRAASDPLVRRPLVLPLSDFTQEQDRRKYRRATFDLVLAKA